MWQTLAYELLKSVVIPQLLAYIEETIAQTGKMPTKEDLEGKAFLICEETQKAGQAFLNRPPE